MIGSMKFFGLLKKKKAGLRAQTPHLQDFLIRSINHTH